MKTTSWTLHDFMCTTWLAVHHIISSARHNYSALLHEQCWTFALMTLIVNWKQSTIEMCPVLSQEPSQDPSSSKRRAHDISSSLPASVSLRLRSNSLRPWYRTKSRTSQPIVRTKYFTNSETMLSKIFSLDNCFEKRLFNLIAGADGADVWNVVVVVVLLLVDFFFPL